MNWDKTRVLVVGDVMLDRWIYMKKTRMSAEAPIPIVEEREYFAEFGGAGNALRHLHNLSKAEHYLIGVRGLDSGGAEIESLKNLKIGSVELIIDSSRRTTVKERFYIDGLPVFRKDVEDSVPLTQDMEDEILHEVSKRIRSYEVLLLSDYAKGLLTESLITNLLEIARANNKPVVSDPGLGRVPFFAGCDVIKPNAKEWQEFVESRRDESEALAWLFSLGTKFVIVTQGEKGVICFSEGERHVAAAFGESHAVDVTGAGDSVAAAISLIVGSGEQIKHNLTKLNQVGGLTVAQLRTSLPRI